MKRSTLNGTAPAPNEAIASLPKNNGKPKSPDESLNLNVILAALQSMRNGDFTVRLPGTWVGLPGKIADTFNDIVAANQHMAQDLKRVGHVVGKQGNTRELANHARWRLFGTAPGFLDGSRRKNRGHVQRDCLCQSAHGPGTEARRPGGRQARQDSRADAIP